MMFLCCFFFFFFFQAEDGIRDYKVTGVQTCALPIYRRGGPHRPGWRRQEPRPGRGRRPRPLPPRRGPRPGPGRHRRRRQVTRALGLDLGTRRIGIALSDSAGTLATPYEVVIRSGDRARDLERIAALADEAGAELVVVGLPRSLDGSIGPAARAVLDEVDELRARLAERAVGVVTWDERLSTVEAERRLRSAGVKGARGRRVVDQVAARVILQSWLDGGQPRG